MKVLITKKLLEEIVSNTSSYLDKKDLSSITSHLLMSAKDGIFSIETRFTLDEKMEFSV